MKEINKVLVLLSVFLLTMLLAVSCKKDNNEVNPEPVDNDPVEVSFTGSINHVTYTPDEEASCELNRIPRSFAKFKEMYEMAAVEPQGVAAMFIVAMEMYKQNATLGEKCMAYTLYNKSASNPETLPAQQMSIIKSKLLGTDSYAQPYLSMAYYEGATPSNQYVPEKYKVNFYVKPGASYDPLTSAQSFVIPLKVKAYGVDWNNNPNRDHNVDVVKPAGQDYYLLFSYMDLFIGVLPPVIQ